MVADLEDVLKGRIKSFIESMRILKNALRLTAEKYLPELTYGGLTPEDNQYAEIPARPEMFKGVTGDVLKDTFRQNITSTGWQTVLQADLGDNSPIGTSYVMGVAGIVLADPVKRVTQIQMFNADYSFPVIDIEALKTNRPVAIIFNIKESKVDRFIYNKDRPFRLDADFISTGYQEIIPLASCLVPKTYAIKQTY